MNNREMQAGLTTLKFYTGAIDGAPSAAMEKAVVAFQKAYGLVTDGIAGPQTQTALARALTQPKAGRPEPDKSAMAGPVPPLAEPPNVASLKLLDTARPIDTLFVHCAATAEGKDYTVADIRAWHFARGFSDIGYHYVVYRDGSIQLGRPVGQVGAHVENHNTGSIGICYVGGVTKDGKTAKDTRTPEQRSSLLWLAKQLITKHRIKRVRGHNEVAAKACPSFIVKNDELGKLI